MKEKEFIQDLVSDTADVDQHLRISAAAGGVGSLAAGEVGVSGPRKRVSSGAAAVCFIGHVSLVRDAAVIRCIIHDVHSCA